jgi:hypothetical protein
VSTAGGPDIQFFRSDLGGLITVVVTVALWLLVLWWAWRPGHADRWLVVLTAIGFGALVAAMNAVMVAEGWWGGAFFALPPLMLAILLFFQPALLVVPVLLGYRWLVRHRRHPRLIYGLASLVVLVPVTVAGDVYGLSSGGIAFGGGYTIAHDVALAQALVWAPVGLYEAFRRDAGRFLDLVARGG